MITGKQATRASALHAVEAAQAATTPRQADAGGDASSGQAGASPARWRGGKPRPALVLSPDQLDRDRPLRSQIYEILRRMILTSELPAGAIVDEKAIAAGLGVSRTPVREAVKKLADQNLIEVRPQSGTIVAAVLRRDVDEAFLIRRSLEEESAGAAAHDFSDDDMMRLERILVLHERAIDNGDYIAAIGYDDEFHHAIAVIAGLPKVWQAVEEFKAPLDRCRFLTVPQWGSGPATLEHHSAIIDALARRDETAARAAMCEHLDSTYAWLKRLLDETGAP